MAQPNPRLPALLLDVGNTTVTAGLALPEGVRRLGKTATDAEKSTDSYAAALEGMLLACDINAESLAGLCVGSVVPRLDPVWVELARRWTGRPAVALSHQSRMNIVLAADHPGRVGVDRWVNAAAAWNQRPVPTLVVDLGTATTVDAVDGSGRFLGGIIAPGPRLLSEALRRDTAQLPRVEMRRPAAAIGSNTEDAIASGLYHGFLGMTERLLAQAAGDLEGRTGRRPRVVATGGWAGVAAEALPALAEVQEDLTLEGLALLYGLNQF